MAHPAILPVLERIANELDEEGVPSDRDLMCPHWSGAPSQKPVPCYMNMRLHFCYECRTLVTREFIDANGPYMLCV